MKKIIFIIILILITNNGLTKEENYFLSLKNSKVNVRYGPGFNYPIKYIINISKTQKKIKIN